MTFYCKAQHCRHASHHVTAGHRCGTCADYGHGCVECGNSALIATLKTNTAADKLPAALWCKKDQCTFAWSHTTDSHNCSKCGGNHTLSECGTITAAPVYVPAKSDIVDSEQKEGKIRYKITCPLCKVTNTVPNDQKDVFGVTDKCAVCLDADVKLYLPQCGHTCLCKTCANKMNEIKPETKYLIDDNSFGLIDIAKKIFKDGTKVYTKVSAGMGCMTIVRRTGVTDCIEGIFMHSDDWGQYGDDTKVKELNAFINGYTYVSHNDDES